MEKVAVISAVRTPIGRFLGSLKEIPAYELGAIVLNEAAKRAKVKPEQVDYVSLAQSYQNGEYVNISRMALLCAGWPVEIPGVTVDCRCCSGLEALCFAAMNIQTGNAEIMAAGGVEHMSSAEFYIPGNIRWGIGGKTDPKWGFMPRGHGNMEMWGIPFFDRLQRGRVMSQPIARFGELNSMMTWAETAAKQEHISREEADKWSLRSHQKAVAAMDSGKFKEEIVPISIAQGKGKPPQVIDADETPRRDTTLEQLAKLAPVYKDGICTAGNSSSENDGAAACVMTTQSNARKLGVQPMAYLKSFAMAGADPTLTYPSVPVAVSKALKKAGLTIDQIDLIEIQEAFACQCLADARLMGLKPADMESKVNVNGSGISLGHPIAATGTMRTATLLHEMGRRKSRYGLVCICGGGGLGIAGVFEREA